MIDPPLDAGSNYTRHSRIEYRILDSSGEPRAIHEHVRDPKTGEKQCYWKQPNGKSGLNGTRLEDLPLYGVHELDDEAMLTVVVEGEKARDALREVLQGAEMNVVGTITGASGTPSRATLEALGGHEVVLWPDSDGPGAAHMASIAERLQGIAAAVRVYGWEEAPEVWVEDKDGELKLKGQDAADHPAVTSGNEKAIGYLLNDLAGAPRYTPSEPTTKEIRPAKIGGDGGPITAAELMDMEFEPTRWVVPDVLPEGVTLLAAKPKKGKSWMALGLCEAVAIGGVALGTRPVEQGDTLYLALEDNKKRLKKRLKKILDGRPAPEKMHLHTSWPRLDEGGTEKLDDWLTDHPEARLVVIDTLVKVRRLPRSQNVYREDYAALESLIPLAAEHGVAILVVYHLRKEGAFDPVDEISSSTGLTAGVDGFLILRRVPGSKGPTLYVDGRDIEEPTEYALDWNSATASWTIEGEAEEVRRAENPRKIIEALKAAHPDALGPKDISEHTGIEYDTTRDALRRMLAAEEIASPTRGRYTLAHNAHNAHNAGHAHNAHKDDRTYLCEQGENDAHKPGDVIPLPIRDRDIVSNVSVVSRPFAHNPDEPRPVVSRPDPVAHNPDEPPASSNGKGRRLSPEEVADVQRLIGQGMAPAFARAEVLRGKEGRP